MNTPKSKPLFFDVKGSNLFGLLHKPEIDRSETGFVFCYPFGEERIRVHRVYLNFAKILAGKGFTVLQFDYRGCGDSQGDWSKNTIESYLEDISAAIDYLLENTEVCKICLLGLRFGATLSNMISELDNRVGYQILWSPILNVKDYIYEKLRVNLAAQVSAYRKVILTREQLVENLKKGETVNIEGYELSRSFYSGIEKIDLLGDKKRFTGKTFICDIVKPKRPLKASEHVEQLYALYDKSGSYTELAVVEAEYFWELLRNYYPVSEELFEKTLMWVNAYVR